MARQPNPTPAERPGSVEMPEPTAWPLVLAMGVVLLAAAIITHPLLYAIGGILVGVGLAGWVACLLPGEGHVHEPLAPPEQRPPAIRPTLGAVEQMRPDRPGYRFQMPVKIHPISAGLKGGIAGGLAMPLPALLYGILSGNGPWFVINLLGGMVFPYLESVQLEYLQRFNLTLLVVAIVIHAIISVSVGLVYGVLLPTLPQFPGSQILFGGFILPLVWSGLSFGLMGTINPPLEQYVEWHFFVASQLVFGIVASLVVIRTEQVYIEPVGPGPGPTSEGGAS